MQPDKKGVLLAALSGMFYGTLGWFGLTIVNSGMSIPTMLFWRFLFAAIIVFLLFPFFFKISWKHQFTFFTKTFCYRFILTMLFASTSSLTYFLAAEKIGTGLGMVIFFSFPVLVVLLAWAFDNQKPSIAMLIAIIGILFGCALVSNLEAQTFELEGIIYAVIAAFTYAFYIYWNKKVMHGISSTFMTGLVCIGNAFVLGLFAVFTNSFSYPADYSIWLLLLGVSFFATALPMLFLLEAMKFTTASLVSILSVLEPLVTLTIGIFALNETATIVQLCGAALILCSAILAQQQNKVVGKNMNL